jgi:hypothetical protein
VSEIVCSKIKLKPGSLERVKQWVNELNQRKDEVIQTLQAEGVLIEAAFLDSTEQGDYLIYFIKVENYERAHEVFKHSTFAIDAYHKEFQQATHESSQKLDVLIDFENFPR